MAKSDRDAATADMPLLDPEKRFSVRSLVSSFLSARLVDENEPALDLLCDGALHSYAAVVGSDAAYASRRHSGHP